MKQYFFETSKTNEQSKNEIKKSKKKKTWTWPIKVPLRRSGVSLVVVSAAKN